MVCVCVCVQENMLDCRESHGVLNVQHTFRKESGHALSPLWDIFPVSVGDALLAFMFPLRDSKQIPADEQVKVLTTNKIDFPSEPSVLLVRSQRRLNERTVVI